MLKNEIKVFNNTQFGEVRVAELNGEPIFCLKDLCDLLKLSNNRKVKSQLDEDVTLSYPLETTFFKKKQLFFVFFLADTKTYRIFAMLKNRRAGLIAQLYNTSQGFFYICYKQIDRKHLAFALCDTVMVSKSIRWTLSNR